LQTLAFIAVAAVAIASWVLRSLEYKRPDFTSPRLLLGNAYAALMEKQDKALLCGEPGSGKSTLALKFA
jgi:energy-coupling factor transporter ATP-binding protein EcfA2